MAKGKIVLLPFPFDDFSSIKVRPVLCLTDPIGEHRHLVVTFITSHVSEAPLASDIVLSATHADFSSTGLRVSSTIQLHRLMTISSALIKRELGTLPLSFGEQITHKLRALFSL